MQEKTQDTIKQAETTQILAKFAATLTYDDLPPRVREHCKNLLLDAIACAIAGNRGEETGQVAAFATALAQGLEFERDRRRAFVVGRCDAAQRLSRHRDDDVRRAPCDHDPHHAGDCAAGADDRGTRRPVRSRSSDRHRCWFGSDDADRHRARLSGISRPRLAWAGHYRPFRRGGRRRFAVTFRSGHHGARLRPCRQPGRRHLRRLGHADGEVPSMPRCAVGPDGGAVGAAKFCCDARIPHRQGRRPLPRLCQRWLAGRRHCRSRQAL